MIDDAQAQSYQSFVHETAMVKNRTVLHDCCQPETPTETDVQKQPPVCDPASACIGQKLLADCMLQDSCGAGAAKHEDDGMDAMPEQVVVGVAAGTLHKSSTVSVCMPALVSVGGPLPMMITQLLWSEWHKQSTVAGLP